MGSGSGFFISPDGYLVTNNHVVEGASTLNIIYAQGGQAAATIVGTAPEFDIAVLKVEGTVPATVEWGNSSELPLGAHVIAIGSALGEYQNSVTQGILSGFNRQVGPVSNLLQTDAAINHGNSGGPLVNLDGQVIGVNAMVVRGNDLDAEGLGFAIPSNVAQSVARNLIETGSARQPFLGIQYQSLNPQLANQTGLSITEGALLESVLTGTPAQRAGQKDGDVIIANKGLPLKDRQPLVSILL
jgi:2-alkenal reductase